MTTSNDMNDVLAALRRAPPVLEQFAAAIPPALRAFREGPGQWTPFEVFCHLADAEIADWMPRVEVILAGGGAFAPYDREGGFARYRGWDLPGVAAEFVRLRHENLERIEARRPGIRELAMTGLHPEFGPVTLGQLFATWATHDMAHAAQLSRILVRAYGRDVGPWTKYFSLLNPRSGT